MGRQVARRKAIFALPSMAGGHLTPQLSSGGLIKCERSELPQPPDCFNVR